MISCIPSMSLNVIGCPQIWDRYCKLGCRRPDFTKKQMLQKFAVAELFFRYPRVYSEAAGGLVPLCGSEPPAALVEAAGGKGAVDAICGIAVSDVWSTRLFKGAEGSVVHQLRAYEFCVGGLHPAALHRTLKT